MRRFTDLQLLLLLAVLRLIFHCVTNGQYGFHRDELAFLDNGRHLAWGYVAYPPLTPFVGNIAQNLFGLSLIGVRFFNALAQCVAMVITGLMAKELGGARRTQVVTAVAAAIAPMSLAMGHLFQYIAFDYLWWVLIAYFLIRRLKSNNPQWWLPIGICIGLGMLTKYTMAFYVAGIVVSVLLTPLRNDLRSRWLWFGVAASILVFLPNLVWQIQHEFVSIDMLQHISARDRAMGRSDGFIAQQLYVSANPFTLWLWVVGLAACFFSGDWQRYRPLGWLYVATFALFLLMRGRFYYLAPAYPMLLAVGCVVAERWLQTRTSTWQLRLPRVQYAALAMGAVIAAVLMVPLGPVHSATWNIANAVHDNLREQIGWDDLVVEVADIYAQEIAQTEMPIGIIASNYGEAAALNLFGPEQGLPTTISTVNSYWLRGYGSPAPEVIIAVGFSMADATKFFAQCHVAGKITNAFGIQNEETMGNTDILVCTELRRPWSEIWPTAQTFG